MSQSCVTVGGSRLLGGPDMLTTRLACLLLASTAGVSAAAASSPDAASVAAASGRSNVVVILLDDARYDDLSTLPQVVNQIGDAGATFSDFYTPFPLCCPARATLFTGQYAHNHHVLDNKAPLGGWSKFDDSSTIATWLDPTYTTGLIGKYFNQYKAPYKPPGWDEWMVPKSMYNYTYPQWSIDTGAGATNVSYPGNQTDTMGALAESFITRHASDRQPFFLYTSIVAPHVGAPADPDDPSIPTPYVKPLYRDTFAGLADTDPSFNEADVSDKPVKPKLLTDAQITDLTERNAQRRESELSAQDATVRIMDALRATGQLDNTYVIFMSDNGYNLGEHRIRGGKVGPYQVDNRVPLLVRGPGIAPGTTINRLSAQVDFAPTVLGMTRNTGANGPSSIDGIDMLPAMMDPANTPVTRQAIVLEAGPPSTDTNIYRYHGLRSGPWKFVRRSSGAKELYNLTDDPYELDNVAAHKGFEQTQAQFDAQAKLTSMLETYQWCSGQSCQ